MLPNVRQQCTATSNRNVEEAVVEATFLGRREFAMAPDTVLAELFTHVLESDRREADVHPEQAGRNGNGLGLDLNVPQQVLGRCGK
ncbi:hypothetical protein [Streptomyces sp. NPDC058964]|uniref:hypothetical protein n=1 Tax=Streptomyces sp. NPDC058964 TaxID=3346681 RepID=UPI00368E3805